MSQRRKYAVRLDLLYELMIKNKERFRYFKTSSAVNLQEYINSKPNTYPFSIVCKSIRRNKQVIPFTKIYKSPLEDKKSQKKVRS